MKAGEILARLVMERDKKFLSRKEGVIDSLVAYHFDRFMLRAREFASYGGNELPYTVVADASCGVGADEIARALSRKLLLEEGCQIVYGTRLSPICNDGYVQKTCHELVISWPTWVATEDLVVDTEDDGSLALETMANEGGRE